MKNITVKELKNIVDLGVEDPSLAFINVCTPVEYSEKHIKGFKNIPLDTIEENIESIKDKHTIYIHCMSGVRSEKAVEKIERHGITSEIINIDGGLNAWIKAGFPTVSFASSRMPIMRQVFLTAGLLVLSGIVLTLITKNLNFLYISGFVGLGLTVSGLTGWCGMHFLLSRMPWNKGGKC